MAQYLAGRFGEPQTWPRHPDGVLLMLDRLMERGILVEEDAARRKSICIVLEYAQHLAQRAT